MDYILVLYLYFLGHEKPLKLFIYNNYVATIDSGDLLCF